VTERAALPNGTTRYAIFLSVVVLSALSPAVPHSINPNTEWWLASWGVLTLMVLAGYVGAKLPPRNWFTTIAPLLLFPAIWCLRCADGNSASGFTPLIFLPVLWFALYGRLRDVVLAIIGGALTAFLPMLVVGSPEYPTSSWRGFVLLVIIIAAIGPVIYRLVETTRRTNRALRSSEIEFRAAFEDAPVGMAITGLRGEEARRFVRVNRALCTMFGRSAEELTSMPITALTHPDDIDLTNHRFEIAGDQDGPQRIQKRYLHKSGRSIWVAVSFSIVHDEHGKPAHFISQIEDISARLESDKALLDAFETDLAATERMNKLVKMRAEMASTVSHELRTPLTSAAGYVELLAEGDAGPLTSEQRMMLDTVSRSLARLDGIVDDVLSMANDDGPRAPVEDVIADVSVVLHAALDTLSLQAASHGLDIVVQDNLDGAAVAGDPGRIERVLVNLLTNAVKFTADDGVITVTASRDEDSATIAVADNGIGIAEDEQTRIFERFYRADTGPDQKTTGTGLGLAIVQAITTQYGGTISVDSELGKGSTFTLTLPLQHQR
jgi:two-component system sensor histidine kinase/response regulator